MAIGDDFMANYPQHEDDLKCPFCGMKQDTGDWWELGISPMNDETTEIDCQSCEKTITVGARAITWWEVRPNEEQMRDPNCERCQSDDFMTKAIWWNEHKRAAYHHDDKRPEGGKIELVFHERTLEEVHSEG